jgi:hypothetical protein
VSFFHAPIESPLFKNVKGLSLTFGTAPFKFNATNISVGYRLLFFDGLVRIIAGFLYISDLADIRNQSQKKMLPGEGLCAKIGQLLSEYRLAPVIEGAQDEWADVPFNWISVLNFEREIDLLPGRNGKSC